MTAEDELYRKEKQLSIMLKVFVGLLVLIGLCLIVWVVFLIAFPDELFSEVLSTSLRRANPLTLVFSSWEIVSSSVLK
ncbi:MAG: hypothetical protein KFH87_03870 [Bacteroidetes bacterium]|nr:hypothetical protein [Bacteroidota bacterium]